MSCLCVTGSTLTFFSLIYRIHPNLSIIVVNSIQHIFYSIADTRKKLGVD
jgi:hypothetical protein